MAELSVLAPMRLEAAVVRRHATDARVYRTGIGRSRAVRAGRHLRLPPDGAAAVVGLAGGLDEALRAGDVVVASEVRSPDGRVLPLPGQRLLAAALARAGCPVVVGPIVSEPRIVRGAERQRLAASGASAVDMESVWLCDAMTNEPSAAGASVVVLRVVSDTPHQEVVSRHAPGNVALALRRIGQITPVLEDWARAVGPRRLLLAGPRSFCAGVDRAIDIVERALERFGPPVYVRRQIIHNTHVVRELEGRGAVFVQEVDDVPEQAVLVLAAHGVAPTVRTDAAARSLRVIDATCPLVAKVHAEARRFAGQGRDIVLIGHRDHEEVEGTVGEAPDHITVVASSDELDTLSIRDPDNVGYLTQTTLAVAETQAIVDELRRRFPTAVGPRNDDICYATQNRQEAVETVARESDLVIVVGSANSSNSKRLVEVAARTGTEAHLVDDASEVELGWLHGAETVGITAGASAPEHEVQDVVDALGELGPTIVEDRIVHVEDVSFRLPQEVR